MLCSKEKCFGCYACANICARKAIDFVEDDTGAMYPRIDQEKCINCGMCEKICPVINKTSGNKPILCFAAWSKSGEIRKNAASGGIASSLYENHIKNSGVCFGARYIHGVLQISEGDTDEAIKAFSGSKYIHAYVGTAFFRAKMLLDKGKDVIFVGTPCQIAGLRSYLRRDYENLLLVDLICHGVSPQSFLKEYINDVSHVEYESALFRGKEGNCLVAYAKGKRVYQREKWVDPYSMAYAKGVLSRENCYSCPFATLSRQGDITLGDFWGLNKDKLHIDVLNIPFVSLVFVNTEKGKRAFEKLKDAFIFEECSVSEAVAGNKQLSEPCKKNEEREQFLKNLKRIGFVKALKKTHVYKDTRRAYRIKVIKTPFRILKWVKNGGK